MAKPARAVFTGVFAAVVVTCAAAQDYPTRPLHLVVPFPAGGGTDIQARALAAQLSRSLGQNVIVENRPGANTLIGAEAVMRAPADGYMLLFTGSAHIINPLVKPKMSFDVTKDYAAVARVGLSVLALSVHPSLPARNLEQLIALARAHPGELTFATAAVVGGQRLATEAFFRQMAKVEVTGIAYNGGAPAATAVVGGHNAILVSNVSEAMQQIRAGRLRGIAVMSLKRTEQLPEVPTIAESGWPGFEASNWYGAVIRAATPRAIVERLAAEIAKALETPPMREHLAKMGFIPAYLGSADFEAYMRAEMKRYAAVVQALNLRLE
jgi:tripartite-type tricarboxylate transporter receptor subunit TctC